jgi:O-phosphoseryl-tRNA(Cys) synthetase
MEVRPRGGLSSRLVDGEMVILDRENDRIHQLNATASLVWLRLGGKIDSSEIASELADRYDVAKEVALADVERILMELKDLDLIATDVSRD